MAVPPMLDEETWSCPICMSLLYKPTVASACGHIFCFWCCHKSMSPFSPSKCPLCRTTYGHFPDVCNLLHHFLLKAFPEQYEARAEETREIEMDEEVTSVEVSVPTVTLENEWAQAVQSLDPKLSLADFLCAKPGCGQLLSDPVVLNCGCCVCAGCRPALGGSCPSCGAISVTSAFVCSKTDCMVVVPAPVLKELVLQLFPDWDWKQAASRITGRQAVAGMTGDAERAKRAKVEGTLEQAGVSTAASVAQESQDASSPSTGPPQNDRSQAAIQARLTAANTHYGIACDYCGQYPIVGKRWQCLECLERVGFDLCSACYEKQADVIGRFNQHHKAEHKMKQVDITPNFLHVLQAANPELDMPQILGMMQMAFESEEPPIPHVHRGGPRPSYETHPMAPGNLAAAAMLAHGQMGEEDDMADTEMLVHTQAPHFLQPGQLMDQVPMDVSISRGQGEEASRQHNTSAQSVLSTQATPAAGQQQAADQLQANSVGASTAENSISRAFSGGERQAEQHEGRRPGESPGVAVGVTPEGSLLTVVLPPVRAATGSHAAVPRARPEEDPPEQAR